MTKTLPNSIYIDARKRHTGKHLTLKCVFSLISTLYLCLALLKRLKKRLDLGVNLVGGPSSVDRSQKSFFFKVVDNRHRRLFRRHETFPQTLDVVVGSVNQKNEELSDCRPVQQARAATMGPGMCDTEGGERDGRTDTLLKEKASQNTLS